MRIDPSWFRLLPIEIGVFMAEKTELETLRARVDGLEMTVSFQERVLGDLDQVVQAFAKRVEQLERALERMRAEANELEVGPANDPPPHY